ncbi:NACHT, LRR and PYD domains-containing protein 1 homolog isoform X1 [Hydra vulgaris]|uniref:NACHT, LRR and PYD domains-containing protein 1 homolog isoform X1 n=1 Tax=Hydra vulgaris TaxID=6087 RepID=UPI001F5FC5AA|nr:NACHT, LRR and PYD domains-containing protein 1 homolog isoform X1 [Hydra vulgaris]
MDNKKHKDILLKIADNLLGKDVEAIKFYYSHQIGHGQLERIKTPIELIQTLEHRMLLGIDNYDDFVEVLNKIGRNDLANHFSKTLNSSQSFTRTSSKKETLSSPESSSRTSSKKDISEICTALKSLYLSSYVKINEVQVPLKSPANVNLMHKFVDLCIVDAVNAQTDAVLSERKEFLQKQLRYTPIPYSEIFTKDKSVTIISGIAGIGKTWLLRKCLLDWSNGLIWKNVKLVFYLECRRLNQYQNISNIHELLNVFYKIIINDFDISTHSTLFIIDGLDEFKYLNELINCSSSCNYPIVNVLTEIRKYKYVVAGRVYAIDQYQSISTEDCDKINIQIMGFNEGGINNYIENNVLEEKKDVVKATLKESAIAKSMSSVPFFLSFMCRIISNSKSLYKNSFLTMTDLYANIFLHFLQKHIIKNNESIFQFMKNNSNKEYILNICKIAYQLFVENKVIFSKEDIQTFIIDFDKNEETFFGFIERIETSLGEYIYQFAHLTIMEFCASIYAYNCLSSEEIMTNEKLKSCLSMICGLTNKNLNSSLKFLVNLNPLKQTCEDSLFLFSIFDRLLKLYRQSKEENNYQLETYYVYLFVECFYESQSSLTDEIKLIVDEQEWKISIHVGKTSYETSCENYFVNHYIKSGRKLWQLSVYKNILSDEEKNLIIKCSTNVRIVGFFCPIKLEGLKPKDKIEKLFIYISQDLITKKDFEEIFLPWINLCKGLHLFLHDDIDFIEEICEWIRCSNVKRLSIKYRGKYFDNLDELKNFITQYV